MKLGLRARLLGTVIGAMLLFFAIVMFAVRATLTSDLHNLAVSQVGAGADAFSASLVARTDQTRNVLTQAAAQQNLSTAVAKHDTVAAKEILQGLQQPNGLSWITVTDTRGRVLARANGLDSGTVSAPMVRGAEQNRILSGAIKLDEQALAGEFLTEDAAPLKSAIGIAAATPIHHDGRVVGVLYGGTLLSGASKVVDGVSRFTGGKAQVLLGDRVAATTLEKSDGSRALNVGVSHAAGVLANHAYTGPDTANDTEYFAKIDPIVDFQGSVIGASWFGIPSAQLGVISSHATNLVLLYGVFGLLLAVGLAAYVVGRVCNAIMKNSEQVSDSAEQLEVLVIGSEVSNDHVTQTREKLEIVEELVDRIVPLSTTGDGARLRTLTREATGDVIVIDTLASELNGRMRGAVDRVAELNDVVRRLNTLVNGSRRDLN